MSSSIRIESVVKEKNRMGECPVWEEWENALIYVDINSQKVCRWSAVSCEVQCVSVGKGTAVMGMHLSQESPLCLQRERFDPKGCVCPGSEDIWRTWRWRDVVLERGGCCRGDWRNVAFAVFASAGPFLGQGCPWRGGEGQGLWRAQMCPSFCASCCPQMPVSAPWP